MPSFDVVSEVDKHELTNAIDQANRELATRFDFKGTDAKFELEGFVVTQVASSAFQLKQMLDILRGRLSARGIDVRCLDVADPLENLGGARQKVTIKQGIEQPVARNSSPPSRPPSSRSNRRSTATSCASPVRSAMTCRPRSRC